MNAAVVQLLFAQISREEFGRAFRGVHAGRGLADFAPYIAAAGLIGVGFVVYSHLKKRNDMSRRCDDPGKLFRELCLLHELDRPSQRLLASLAKACQFAQPAQVFLCPSVFTPEGIPAALHGRVAELAELRARLFA